MCLFSCTLLGQQGTQKILDYFLQSVDLYYIKLNVLKESKIMVIIMGLSADCFLCTTLTTACQLQVKISKCSECESILLCRCLGYVGIFLVIVLWHINCFMHCSFFVLCRHVQSYCKCPAGHLTEDLICLILRSTSAEDLCLYTDCDGRTRAGRARIFSTFPSQTEAAQEPIWPV